MSSSIVVFDCKGISVEHDPGDGIFTMIMARNENRFNPDLVQDLSKALSHVEAADHPKALVITGGRGSKFFSNGLDIDWMMRSSSDETERMIEGVWRLLARVLVIDCRSVAAINGHAFGAGLFLALACDYRVMRTGRGFVNFPEVNLGMRLAKGFAEISKAKCSQSTLREGVLTGKRYGSDQAKLAGLVDVESSIDDLPHTARELAKAGHVERLGFVNFNPVSFSQVKIELYVDAYRALTMGLTTDPPHSRL